MVASILALMVVGLVFGVIPGYSDTVTLVPQSIQPPLVSVDDGSGNTIYGTNINELRFCGTSASDASMRMVPNMFGNNPLNDFTNNEGTMTSSFAVATAGLYRVSASMLSPTSASNSFYVRLDSGKWTLWDTAITTKPTLQSLIFAPAFNDRNAGDHYCWNLTAGTHSFGIRWRELGAWFGAVTVSAVFPALNVTALAGCTPAGAVDCPTAGSVALTLRGASMCQDLTVTVGGKPCANLSMDTAYPNRIATCQLPEGTGGALDVVVSSAGRVFTIPGGLSYATPVIYNITGCQNQDQVSGRTSSCKGGTRVTITGNHFGSSGAQVTVGGVDCTEVTHDPRTPHTRLECALPALSPGAEDPVVVIQAASQGRSLSSAAFPGVIFKPRNYVGIGVGAAFGSLAGLALLVLVTLYLVTLYHNQQSLQKLTAPKAWRLDVNYHTPTPGGPPTPFRRGTLRSAIDVHVFPLPRTVDPLYLDKFAEACFHARIPSLAGLRGVTFRPREPYGIVLHPLEVKGTPVRDFMTKQRDLAYIEATISWLSDLARGAAFLHSYRVSLGSLDVSNVTLCSLEGETKLTALFPSTEIGLQIQKRMRGRGKFNEFTDVYTFGLLCGHVLCDNFSLQQATLAEEQARTARSMRSGRSGTQLQTLRSHSSLRSGRSGRYTTQSVPEFKFSEGVPDSLAELVENCLSSEPARRPNFSVIAPFFEAAEREIVITRTVETRTMELNVAQRRSDQLLSQMIPAEFLESVKVGVIVPARVYENVSVFFCDVIGFTTTTANMAARDVVASLEEMIEVLDGLAAMYGLYRVNTIGDAYFAICGAPTPAADHCARTARFALAGIEALQRIRLGTAPLAVRAGIHTGPVAGGIQGKRVPRFDVFGATVNLASRLESTGLKNQLQLSEEAMHALKAQAPNEFSFIPRPDVAIKGIGSVTTYLTTKAK